MSHWLHIAHAVAHIGKYLIDDFKKLRITCGLCKGVFQLNDPEARPPLVVKCQHCGTVNKVSG